MVKASCLVEVTLISMGCPKVWGVGQTVPVVPTLGSLLLITMYLTTSIYCGMCNEYTTEFHTNLLKSCTITDYYIISVQYFKLYASMLAMLLHLKCLF